MDRKQYIKAIVTASKKCDDLGYGKAADELLRCASSLLEEDDNTAQIHFDNVNKMVEAGKITLEAGFWGDVANKFRGVKEVGKGIGKDIGNGVGNAVQNVNQKYEQVKQQVGDKVQNVQNTYQKGTYQNSISQMETEVTNTLEKFKSTMDTANLKPLGDIYNKYSGILNTIANNPSLTQLKSNLTKFLQTLQQIQQKGQEEEQKAIQAFNTLADQSKDTISNLAKQLNGVAQAADAAIAQTKNPTPNPKTNTPPPGTPPPRNPPPGTNQSLPPAQKTETYNLTN